jgi:hypothetical protein
MANELTFPLAETYEYETSQGLTLPFNESPNKRILASNVVNTGSIDTSVFDPYRQGVELRLEKHYQQGIVKIHCGEIERGHHLRQTEFGLSIETETSRKRYFAELEYFDPYVYITSQATDAGLDSFISRMTYPIILTDSFQACTSMDGIIEPLPIRSIVTFSSIDAPYESHGVRGELQEGNPDDFLRVDVVSTKREFNTLEHVAPFLDLCAETVGDLQQTGLSSPDVVPNITFDDSKQARGLYLDSESFEFSGFIDDMDPSTDNYVQFDEVSMACGHDYENSIGPRVDSMIFGNLLRTPSKSHYTF